MDTSFDKEKVSQYKCIICYSSFCSTTECENQQQQQLQKINQMYRLYLEPEVNCTSADRDILHLQSEHLTSNRFCAKCYSSGEKLSVMDQRLTSIQSEIQIFVKQLLEEITECRYYAKNLVQSSSEKSYNIARNLLTGRNSETDANKTKSDFYTEVKQEWQEKEENMVNSLSGEDDDDIFEDVTEWISDNNDLVPVKDCRLTNIDSGELLHGDINPKVKILDLDSIDCIADSSLCQRKAGPNNSNLNPLSRIISSEFELSKLTVKLERLSSKIIKRYTSKTSFKASSNRRQEKETTQILRHRREQAANLPGARQLQVRRTKTKLQRRSELKKEEDDSIGEDSTCEENYEKNTTPGNEKSDELKTFSCIASCSKQFSNRFDLEVHKLEHTGQIPYECQKCHEKFSNVTTYCAHQKQSQCRESFGVYKCDQCDELFDAQYLLLLHTTRKHTNLKDRYKMCSICDKQLNLSAEHVESHYMEHTNEGIFSCDICGQPNLFTSKMLKVHRMSHSMYLKCSYCDKIFSNHYKLKVHITTVHNVGANSTPGVCEICGKTFKNANYLRKHMHIHRDRQVFKCDQCPKTFYQSRALQQHLRVFHCKETYSCEICGRQYNEQLGVTVHMSRVHLNLPKPIICETCGKGFYRQSGLRSHIEFNHSEPVQCDICGKMFATKVKLRKHKRYHTGEKVTCKVCDMSFITDWELRHHTDTHHPELRGNRFECTRCHLFFDTVFERRKHWKEMHPKEKKEEKKVCKVCGGHFRSDTFKRHLRRHERDKFGPLKCDQCDLRFMKQQSLTYHVKHYHGPSSSSTNSPLH